MLPALLAACTNTLCCPASLALQDHTAALRLENAANNFERGQMDTFNLVANDVGQLTHVIVVKEGGGLGGDWHLQMVEVVHTGVLRPSCKSCLLTKQ